MKRTVKISLTITIAILFLIIALFLCLKFFSGNVLKDKQVQFSFYEPDYKTDILSDPEYLSLNRIVSYKNGPVMTTVLPQDYEKTDKILSFLASYLDAAIKGDYSNYSDFFTEEYISENGIPEKFTMQRIYNITVEKLNEAGQNANGQTSNQFVYSLSYMIARNDGTFRSDMESDALKPQYLVIKEISGEFYIDKILTNTY